MRTRTTTVKRREHWRWQRCGPGRSELRHVHVRGSDVTLTPDVDARQHDMLDVREVGPFARRSRRRGASSAAPPADDRPLLRSYWRRQPYGPGGSLRKTILVDVRG